MITTVVLLVHVLLALALVGLILLQHGKGADAGAAFGSGASSTVFGSQGSASFMSRVTKWLAIFFFITSGTLAYLSRDQQAPASSLMDAPPAAAQPATSADEDMPPMDAPAEEDTAADKPASEEPASEDAPPPDAS